MLDSRGFCVYSLPVEEDTLRAIRAIPQMTCVLLAQRLLASEDDPRLHVYGAELCPQERGQAAAALRTLLAEHQPDDFLFANRAALQTMLPKLTPPQVAYVFKLIGYIRQDNCATAQATIPTALLSSGFGAWTKVYPAFGLRLVSSASEQLARVGIPNRVADAPHLICPAKGGAALQSHIDGGTALQLKSTLRSFLCAHPAGTNTQFASWNGVQTLVHVQGGRSGSGATCTLSPMTPARQLLLLLVIEQYASHGSRADKAEQDFFSNSSTGPKFYTPSKKVLSDVHRVLDAVRSGEQVPVYVGDWLGSLLATEPLALNSSVQWTEMVPSSAEPGPFTLAFPRGYFHKKQPNNRAGRISLAGGLQCTASAGAGAGAGEGTGASSAGAKRKVNWLLTIAETHSSVPELQLQATTRLQRPRQEPFEGGKSHQKLDYAYDLMGPGGAFAGLRYTTDDVALLVATLAQD